MQSAATTWVTVLWIGNRLDQFAHQIKTELFLLDTYARLDVLPFVFLANQEFIVTCQCNPAAFAYQTDKSNFALYQLKIALAPVVS